jgi:hypothetical protein
MIILFQLKTGYIFPLLQICRPTVHLLLHREQRYRTVEYRHKNSIVYNCKIYIKFLSISYTVEQWRNELNNVLRIECDYADNVFWMWYSVVSRLATMVWITCYCRFQGKVQAENRKNGEDIRKGDLRIWGSIFVHGHSKVYEIMSFVVDDEKRYVSSQSNGISFRPPLLFKF